MDLYRRKLLRYLGPRYLPDMPADLQSGYVDATADVAARFIPMELESTLTRGPVCRRAPPGCGSQDQRRPGAGPCRRSGSRRTLQRTLVHRTGARRRHRGRATQKVRKDPPGVRVVSRPEWVRISAPRLEYHIEGRVVAADTDLRPRGRLGGEAPRRRLLGRLEVPVTCDGEPVVVNRLRYSADDQGQLIVTGV